MKRIKTISLIILSIFIAIQFLKFVFRTPVFTGQVLNVTTNQPIENAIVSAIWWKSKIEGSEPFHSVTVITGKDGKYTIPKYIRLHATSLYMPDPYFCMTLGVVHPLYEGVQPMTNQVWEEEEPQSGKIAFKGEKQADGAIKYDIKLMGLEERYLKEVVSDKSQVISEEEKKIKWEKRKKMGLGFSSYLTVYENGWYWLMLREHSISFDLEKIFKVWNKIDKSLDGFCSRSLKEAKEKIKGKLRDKK